MNYFKWFSFLFALIFSGNTFAQEKGNCDSLNAKKRWFISAAYGIQMSGIKPEDFISSNIAPSHHIAIGVWFTPEIALQLGYKGNYFNTISDKDKHYYSFVLGEVLLNINEIINGNKNWNNKWAVILHSGAGYFYNNYYNRPNICGNLGIISTFEITNHINAFIDVSAIVGWDIYQGDDDILPSCVFGVNYLF